MTDREKLIELMFSYQDEHNSIVVDKGGLADHLLANGVTVQKHGRWVNERELVGGFAGKWGCDCSECGKTIEEPLWKPPYCPNCGAKVNLEG